ncbi:MAG: Uma2 family endonuclease [Leptolyngbyaceae bacterium]|nr:Uma2 family endonuclease [Leptolyngbyaceae bacterium]
MVHITDQRLTLPEFLAMPEADRTYEFVEGRAIPKTLPRFLHTSLQKALLILLDTWCRGRGRVELEWGVILKRRGEDWVPVPDLTYFSYHRLAADWLEDSAYPVPPELVVDIISTQKSFGEILEKATDYLAAGIDRVWVLDSQVKSITVFAPNAQPRIYQKHQAIFDPLFPDLHLTAQEVFQRAGLPSGGNNF